jgi:hypothetical protein
VQILLVEPNSAGSSKPDKWGTGVVTSVSCTAD